MLLKTCEIERGIFVVQEERAGQWVTVTHVCRTQKTAKQRMTTYRQQSEQKKLLKIAHQVMAKPWGEVKCSE